MGKHTHADWICEGGTCVYALNLEGSNRFLCEVQGGWATHNRNRTTTDELRANARLIAAAPELLEALEDAEANLASLCESGDYGMEDRAVTYGFAILAGIRAAIAKATTP
jgi:hypothetical protein